ncbi:MAG: DUF367 family protein [Candidatus Verstraetearchaeota archaeon]|nr:DUF367 family protein [Candidatus Verstraetearchaeota archaeon]
MPEIYIYNKRECDTKKCTAAKLGRLRLAKLVYHIQKIPRSSVILYPFSDCVVSPGDREQAVRASLAAIDCSWNSFQPIKMPGTLLARKLPFLLAANPTNYSIPYKLSTLEALAAALYIMGFKEQAQELLSKVKWGGTFLTLNEEPLYLYSSASNPAEILEIEKGYLSEYSNQKVRSSTIV